MNVITESAQLQGKGKDIGQAFCDARLSLGLSRPALAAVLGYSGKQAQGQIYDMETGRKAITPAVARLMLAYLHGYRPDDWPQPSEPQ